MRCQRHLQVDGLQWIIDECYANGNADQLVPERICHRLLLVNDISMHSTSFTTHNAILDLACLDPSLGCIESMRQEAKQALEMAGGSWSFQAVKELRLIDSAIRESMRLTPFASVGLPRTDGDPEYTDSRQVVHPDGISMVNSNARVARGTVLAVPIEPIHYDEEIYPNAYGFEPFRFARPGEMANMLAKINGNEQTRHTENARLSATLDDAFLGFGFGKHACPGRFFAINEMKIFIAHMLLNYDIEVARGRPKLINLMWLKLPFHDGKVRVRKRSTDEHYYSGSSK
ncbi:hypothetical protein DL769_001334 [Monosporascus sp. CRB-8-3]|nr:hypothetical protein DL769_001334 [Monosporascus sp. CRB-8-3]